MSKNTNDQLKYLPKDDGITHINIFSNSKCKLGKMLSHFYPATIEHPEYGLFANMECFWHYLATGCKYEKIRNMNPLRVKMLSKQLQKVPRDDFMEQIRIANTLKILQHQSILILFRKSSLPFEHYYLFGPHEVLHRPMDAQKLIDMFESIRTEFKETKPWLTNSHCQHSSQDHQTS